MIVTKCERNVGERERVLALGKLKKKNLCLNSENVIFEKLKLFKGGKKSLYLKQGGKS